MEDIINNKIKGDIFIHAGDFSRYGSEKHILNFLTCLKKLEFKHKIVVPGNHDVVLDELMKPSKK